MNFPIVLTIPIVSNSRVSELFSESINYLFMVQSNSNKTPMDIDEHQFQIRKRFLQETLEESSIQTRQISPAKRCASISPSDAPTAQAQTNHVKNSGPLQVNQNPSDKIPL